MRVQTAEINGRIYVDVGDLLAMVNEGQAIFTREKASVDQDSPKAAMATALWRGVLLANETYRKVLEDLR